MSSVLGKLLRYELSGRLSTALRVTLTEKCIPYSIKIINSSHLLSHNFER